MNIDLVLRFYMLLWRSSNEKKKRYFEVMTSASLCNLICLYLHQLFGHFLQSCQDKIILKPQACRAFMIWGANFEVVVQKSNNVLRIKCFHMQAYLYFLNNNKNIRVLAQLNLLVPVQDLQLDFVKTYYFFSSQFLFFSGFPDPINSQTSSVVSVLWAQ